MTYNRPTPPNFDSFVRAHRAGQSRIVQVVIGARDLNSNTHPGDAIVPAVENVVDQGVSVSV